jgi:hypothetical protein
VSLTPPTLIIKKGLEDIKVFDHVVGLTQHVVGLALRYPQGCHWHLLHQACLVFHRIVT